MGSLRFRLFFKSYPASEELSFTIPCEDWFDIYSNEVLVNRLVLMVP